MAEANTVPTEIAVEEFIAAIDHDRKREEAREIDAMFQRITGWKPKMWGPTIIGYGSYNYTYDTGFKGQSLATGFSPRKAKHSFYVMPGYADFGEILGRIGKHKMGKACLYVNKLPDIDMAVLEELIKAGLVDLGTCWEIHPS